MHLKGRAEEWHEDTVLPLGIASITVKLHALAVQGTYASMMGRHLVVVFVTAFLQRTSQRKIWREGLFL